MVSHAARRALLGRRLSTATVAAAFPPASSTWAQASVSRITPATADRTLFHVAVDLSSHLSIRSSHVAAGQFLPFRFLPFYTHPFHLAIASPPPSRCVGAGEFEFLVKNVPGSPAGRLCGLAEGDAVEVGEVSGRGFEVERIGTTEGVDSVLVFATGSGISPIRSLIESEFNLGRLTDIRLYYGARNLHRMAYQDRFELWQSRGVKISPVLSRPDEQWEGERGYIQHAFLRAKERLKPLSTGAVLCGHRQMTEEITAILVAAGVPKCRILTNI